MRVQRRLSIDVPVPSVLPPSVVIAALQTFIPVIRHLGTLARYEPVQPRAGAIEDDPFFVKADSATNNSSPSDNNAVLHSTGSGIDAQGQANYLAVASFQVYELITLAPSLTKEVTYPTHFQRLPNGLRCRADGAAGITGWCEFTVRHRRDRSSSAVPSSAAGSSPDGSASSPSTMNEWEEYELHEAMVIEANSLLMPFVLQTMGDSHRGLCNKILNEVLQQYYDGYDYLLQQPMY